MIQIQTVSENKTLFYPTAKLLKFFIWQTTSAIILMKQFLAFSRIFEVFIVMRLLTVQDALLSRFRLIIPAFCVYLREIMIDYEKIVSYCVGGVSSCCLLR